MLTATEIKKRMQWNKFLESLTSDLPFQAAPTNVQNIDLLSKHATAAYQDSKLAGLTQGTSMIKTTAAQITFVATPEQQQNQCALSGGCHPIEFCRKLQAAQAKRNANVLHARDDELPPPSTSNKHYKPKYQGKIRKTNYNSSDTRQQQGSNAASNYNSSDTRPQQGSNAASKPQVRSHVNNGTTYYNGAQRFSKSSLWTSRWLQHQRWKEEL